MRVWAPLLGMVVAGCAGPAPARVEKAQTHEETCAGCHAAEFREWSGSMHHASFTSPDFQSSWRSEPRSYCADCHAPRRALGADGIQAGIGCAECHDGLAAHVRAPALPVTTKPCAPCHDFGIPNERAVLQTTAKEHAASEYAAVSCADCHAPRREGHRDHRFSSSRDPARLAAALAITPLGYDGHQVSVELRLRGVGHRFPTGDIYRRVTVTVTATAAGRIVCDRIVTLNRDWAEHRRSLRAHDDESFSGDTRLGPEPLRIEAPCVAAPSQVRVTVDYARGAAAHGDALVSFEELELLDVSFAVP